MHCIVCHSEINCLEILALCTRCHKGPIAYNKVNGILAMKKHVQKYHTTFLKRYVEEIQVCLGSFIDWEPTIK
jgi:hypothetical protein